jgi:hypothetical protein
MGEARKVEGGGNSLPHDRVTGRGWSERSVATRHRAGNTYAGPVTIDRMLSRRVGHTSNRSADHIVIRGRGGNDLGERKARYKELECDHIGREPGDQPAAELTAYVGAHHDKPPRRD